MRGEQGWGSGRDCPALVVAFAAFACLGLLPRKVGLRYQAPAGGYLVSGLNSECSPSPGCGKWS
jgi:hypothetical protein